MPTIYALLGWNTDCRYCIMGIRRENGDDAVLLFNLEETEIFNPSDVIDEQQTSDSQTDVKPFTVNQKRTSMLIRLTGQTLSAATTTASHRRRSLPDSTAEI